MRPGGHGYGVLLLAAVLGATSTVEAGQAQAAQLPALKQLSIEELLELDVTLPLRREERAIEAPAPITLLTAEDIRRQGAVALPDALRTVPGLYVARFNASSWIVTSRGFASTAANKMLVMIDGRTVYSPLFSGVFWDQQDAMLEDLERIEVIRGPRASLWGSNAVNGIINVVSKRADQTQGALLSVGGGSEEQFATSMRYGGPAGNGHYRVYGKFVKRDAATLADDVDAEDGQRFGQGGFRLDLGRPVNALTVQGDVYASRVDLSGRQDIRAGGANVLARWTRRTAASAELQLQGYVDRTHRFVEGQIEERRITVDLDAQHRWAAARHTLSVGGSYRRSADDTTPSALLSFDPEDRATDLAAGFVQDEITLTPKALAIAGVKVERNDYTGVEWQPSVRLRYLPARNQTLWGGVSRAVRLPTRLDTDVRVFVGTALVAAGNPEFESEDLVAYEAGYRAAPIPTVAFDLTAFHNRYDDLRTQELVAGRIVVGNGLADRSTGGNISVTVQPRPWARISASYARLSHDFSLDPASRDITGGLQEAIDPSYHGRISGRFDAPHGIELDGTFFFVGALPQTAPGVPGTPAYQEASFRIGWRVSPRVELSLMGRDVLHGDHVEFISPTSGRVTRLQRAIYTRLSLALP